MTEEKYNELKDELDFLITTHRNEVAQQLESARAFGDLSENAEYQEARQEQGRSESRIRYLAALLKDVEIVKKHHGDVVEIGTTVVVQKAGEKEKREYTVVGSEEADTMAGRISSESPFGRALLGKKKGDDISFVTPAGKTMEYTVVKID